MSSVATRARLAALVTLFAMGLSLLPVLTNSAQAADPHTDQGTIATSNIFGLSTTDTDWQLSCPEIPASQGDDAWVFVLPEGFDVTGTTTTAAGQAAGDYDLDIIFYGADCGSTGSSFEPGTDESVATPADTRYVVVTAFQGSDIAVTLTVGAGAGPSPSPTPTSSPSSPGGGGGGGGTAPRQTYPLEPNDPLFPEQDIIFGGQWGMRKIQAPEAWQESQATGAGIRVAVLDSGLDLDHADFNCPGKVDVIADSDFIGDGNGPQDVDGHGTHVAGIIGACTNNGEGVVGVAPDSTIMPIQILDANGEGIVDQTLPGAIRAATDAGAHVINMSIGTIEAVAGIEVLLGDLFPEVTEAIEYAQARGVVIVAAASNTSLPLCSYPAIIEDIVCVGSSDNRDLNSYFGNFPVKDDNEDVVGPAVLAPGGSGQIACDFHAENILSTYLVEADNCNEGFSGYRGLDGTSMASPHVAGVAALVYDRLAGVRNAENAQRVIEALISTADDLYAPGYDPASGYGRVNALTAVQSIAATAPSPSPTPTPTTTDTSVAFLGAAPESGQYSDGISASARLADESGVGIADENLTFQVIGSRGFIETQAVTDATGTASADLDLNLPPGTYELVVAYSGKADLYNSSEARRPFAVFREDSVATLTSTGKQNDLTFSAELADGDSSTAIAGALVTLFAQGEPVAEATTDSDGVAVFDPGKTKKKTLYEVRFAGNDFYLPSSDS
ncbi:MAG: S8 family serine peptidase [Actinomycetota bacterium]